MRQMKVSKLSSLVSRYRTYIQLVPGFSYLADLKPKHLLKVCWLADQEQVEGPASAEISYDDGVHRHGREEGPPWCVEFLCDFR